MRIFKKKCKHESCKIIGKFYFREDYRDCIVVHGVIVSQCPNCQKVILDDRYVEGFYEINPKERVQHSILALKKPAFAKSRFSDAAFGIKNSFFGLRMM